MTRAQYKFTYSSIVNPWSARILSRGSSFSKKPDCSMTNLLETRHPKFWEQKILCLGSDAN